MVHIVSEHWVVVHYWTEVMIDIAGMQHRYQWHRYGEGTGVGGGVGECMEHRWTMVGLDHGRILPEMETKNRIVKIFRGKVVYMKIRM